MGRERVNYNDFNQKLRYSLGERQLFDFEILKTHIPKCVDVKKTDIETDKSGIDYIATLRGGAEICIDAKTREPGCSRYWKNGEPELAIETWSVVENKIPGWTYKENSQVDYILYTFPENDCREYFFIPFQLLRKVSIENYKEWSRDYPKKKQRNRTYHSEAIFVPADVVIAAIEKAMRGVS
jgi:hypothetical protein